MLSNRLFYTLLALVVGINFTALCLPIMEPDNGLYATVAKQMYLTGDYLNLYSCGLDFLDKPRLPFLLNVLFMKLFGFGSPAAATAAYKLPALLCFCGSLWYTYRFARLNYPRLVAQLATLIFGTAYHVILSNTDVRAEPFLTLFIIGPAYHFTKIWQQGERNSQASIKMWPMSHWLHLVAGSALTGLRHDDQRPGGAAGYGGRWTGHKRLAHRPLAGVIPGTLAAGGFVHFALYYPRTVCPLPAIRPAPGENYLRQNRYVGPAFFLLG